MILQFLINYVKGFMMKEIILSVAKKAIPYILGALIAAGAVKFGVAPDEVKQFLLDTASEIK